MARTVRVIGRVVTTLVVMAVLALVALVVVVPRVTGGATLTVLSGSMSPTIPTGSLVVVVPVEPSRVRVGDVITFQTAPGVPEFVTHRVTEVHPETDPLSFTTKGDANRTVDADPVPEGAVRGEVRAHVPYLGFASQLVQTPRGLVLVGGLLALLWLVPYVLGRLVAGRRDAASGADATPEAQRTAQPA